MWYDFSGVFIFYINVGLSMKNIVITGITSKSGKFMLKEMITNAALLADWHFRCSVRPESDLSILQNLPLDLETYTGTLSESSFTDRLLTFEDTSDITLINISGIWCSRRLVESAVKCGVKRLILVHTTGIYSKYKSAGEEYRQIESQIHDLIKDTDISLTILRPTMVYGTLKDNNISVFIRMVDKLPIFPTVNGAKYDLQPIWCGDLGKAYYQVMMQPEITQNKEYILSGGAPIQMIDIYHTIEQYLGRKNHYISIPFFLAYAGAFVLYIFTLGKKDYREKVQRLVEPRAYSHEAATRDFQFHPLPFEEGVKSEIEAYLASTKQGQAL